MRCLLLLSWGPQFGPSVADRQLCLQAAQQQHREDVIHNFQRNQRLMQHVFKAVTSLEAQREEDRFLVQRLQESMGQLLAGVTSLQERTSAPEASNSPLIAEAREAEMHKQLQAIVAHMDGAAAAAAGSQQQAATSMATLLDIVATVTEDHKRLQARPGPHSMLGCN